MDSKAKQFNFIVALLHDYRYLILAAADVELWYEIESKRSFTLMMFCVDQVEAPAGPVTLEEAAAWWHKHNPDQSAELAELQFTREDGPEVGRISWPEQALV